MVQIEMEHIVKYQLSNQQINFWESHGFLKIKNLLNKYQKSNIRKWCDELSNLPDTPGKWMKYYEANTKNEKKLCRIEYFLDFHDEFKTLANNTYILDLISQLINDKAILFKEKINFKAPNSNGFKPHQDAPAFKSFNQYYHVTLMIAIDKATKENGCLKIVKGGKYKNKILPINTDGSIIENIANSLYWTDLECDVGDVVIFDSYVPHYSDKNLSRHFRRAAFITYNKLKDGGSKREEYFADKRSKFPPDCERDPNKDYSEGAQIYNVANPLPVN